jgi:pimeloyl-ACP methyl ester carboxylesterase
MATLTPTSIETNGVRLHVQQAGDPNGPLLILLHGFPEFWYGWKGQIDPLAEASYWLWLPDQRGYNLSDKPQGIESYSIDVLAEDVVGLIQASGRERVTLIAHDWGGAVAWWVAHKYPHLLEKLIVLNIPHPSVMRRVIFKERLYIQLLMSWYMYAFQIYHWPERILLLGNGWVMSLFMRLTARRGAFTAEDYQAYAAAWQQPGAMTAMLNWYRAGFGHVPIQRPTAKRVSVPTLLIWGLRDRFLHHKTGQRSIELCDQGRFEPIATAGHWVLHEEPARVTQLILEFLAESV